MAGLIRATATFKPGDSRGIVVSIKSKLVAAAERSQSIVKQEAEALVPVDTGELALSITALPIEDDGERITAEVVATAPHAGYLEYGTGVRGASSPGAGPFNYDANWPGMAASPYMRPALDSARKRVKEEFSR